MIKKLGLLSIIALMLNACGGTTPPADPVSSTNVTLTGVVSAPTGVVAELQSGNYKTMLAEALLGKRLTAITTGWSAVAAGVSIKLIEVDSAGAQVGAALAETTTGANGSYTLTVPDGFVPGPKYVVRAGSGTTIIDARVPNTGTVDIDPATDAASDLVTTVAGNLGDMTVEELQAILELVQDALADLDTDLTATTISDDLQQQILSDTESANAVYSTAAAGQICGNVKDSTGANLANIRIIVRDYADAVTRAKTKTDSSGNYCLNVPASGDTDPVTEAIVNGEYILGAINFTSTSMAASQWWTSNSSSATDGSGGANIQSEAQKVTVTGITGVTKDFYLDANGARIEGAVAAHDSGSTEGVKVDIRDFDTFQGLAGARVKADGTFRINVKASDYMISFLNSTSQPYASEVWKDTDPTGAGTSLGTRDRNKASKETVIAGTTYSYTAELEAGKLLSGTVTDNVSSQVVQGTRVEFDNDTVGRIATRRTNALGQFRLWVLPRTGYIVRTYGHTFFNIDMSSANVDLNLNHPSSSFTAKMVAADGVTGVARAVMKFIYNDGVGGIGGRLDLLPSNEDGTFTLRAGRYVDHTLLLAGDPAAVGYDATDLTTYPNTSFHVEARMDSNPNYGSGIYTNPDFAAANADSAAIIKFTSGNIDLTSTPAKVPTITSAGGSGVGYLVVQANVGDKVHIGSGGGLSLGTKTNRMIGATTRGDGTFKVSLQGGTYTVRAGPGTSGTWSNCPTVTISDGLTTTIDASSAGACTAGTPQ
ncbi:MAG: hypothetical protein OEX12_01390 [Gammaproteobacteria bacterium]|nr:hypothetical protein [Gammaproteobacteria bacterium]